MIGVDGRPCVCSLGTTRHTPTATTAPLPAAVATDCVIAVGGGGPRCETLLPSPCRAPTPRSPCTAVPPPPFVRIPLLASVLPGATVQPAGPGRLLVARGLGADQRLLRGVPAGAAAFPGAQGVRNLHGVLLLPALLRPGQRQRRQHRHMLCHEVPAARAPHAPVCSWGLLRTHTRTRSSVQAPSFLPSFLPSSPRPWFTTRAASPPLARQRTIARLRAADLTPSCSLPRLCMRPLSIHPPPTPSPCQAPSRVPWAAGAGAGQRLFARGHAAGGHPTRLHQRVQLHTAEPP